MAYSFRMWGDCAAFPDICRKPASYAPERAYWNIRAPASARKDWIEMLRRGLGDRGAGPGVTHYQMRQNLVSIGDDFWIEDEGGNRVAKIDGKALRIRKTLIFEDPQGHEVCKIQEQMLTIRDTMKIEGPNGEEMAVIKKALISPLRDRFTVSVAGGPDLDVQGNLLDHEYEITEGRQKVAEVSKKWFRVRDTYGVEIAPGQNEILMLAVTVGIDMMAHRGH
jgi:uncharacterized protein YxjI